MHTAVSATLTGGDDGPDQIVVVQTNQHVVQLPNVFVLVATVQRRAATGGVVHGNLPQHCNVVGGQSSDVFPFHPCFKNIQRLVVQDIKRVDIVVGQAFRTFENGRQHTWRGNRETSRDGSALDGVKYSNVGRKLHTCSGGWHQVGRRQHFDLSFSVKAAVHSTDA